MDLSTSIEYPDLPVVKKRDDFFGLLKKHQVIIVQADTGSGKSTQLPKFLLEAGYNKQGCIGVTQPRRIAALSIADRLREELHQDDFVCSRIRFYEEGPAQAPIKVMTDGILLQEFRQDRLLRQYSCIVLDEAHERSLNIDILLGILHTVLAKRPEFRLIIASATLDAELFHEFFAGSAVLYAEGRMHPVTVQYRPPEEEKRLTQEISRNFNSRGDSGLVGDAQEAIQNLLSQRPDHLLCFLPTERDIQDLAEDLQRELDSRKFDILPLFGRLSPQDQKRVFQTGRKYKVVLATNIAETSLTIPGIAYVVDTGMARVSRYSATSRIQGLPVEKISQASARQRMGRAGRVKPGICVRLYSEKDLNARPAFTDPEIRRSNLANVVLQLKSLRLRLEEFPFLQPPARSAFRGACRQLHELGALDAPELNARITPLGRDMIRLPMDVALSAVLLKAREEGVLHPALIVCAVLCIQDPRLFPHEGHEKEKARASHRRFRSGQSDFLALVKLWNYIQQHWGDEHSPERSLRKLRRLCEQNYLHFLRVREWMDLVAQFGKILKFQTEQAWIELKSFHPDALHKSLLAGFLGGIAKRDDEKQCWRLVGGREAHLFPGSDLAGKKPEWVMASEVRETSRVFLARAAVINPQWILDVASQFCTKRWYEPMWNAQRGFVEAFEEVQYRSMVISRGKRVDYGRINPDDCAQIFWREAILEDQIARPFHFQKNNARMVEQLKNLESRKRQWGLAPSDDQIIEWYRRRAPGVMNIRTLKETIHSQGEEWLCFSVQDWKHLASQSISAEDYQAAGRSFALRDALQGDQKLQHLFKTIDQKIQRDQRKKASEKTRPDSPQAFGTLEVFEIGKQKVVGHILFDHQHPQDGLTLEIPASIWVKETPATLALQLTQWRNWIWDAAVQQTKGAPRLYLEEQREELIDQWCDLLEDNRNQAPLQSLLELLRQQPGLDAPTIAMDTQETHLKLHLKLVQKGQDPFVLELPPDRGDAWFCLQSWQQLIPGQYWSRQQDVTLGWKLQGDPWQAIKTELTWQEDDLALWWSSFFSRLADISDLQDTWLELLTDRLQLLDFAIEKNQALQIPHLVWWMRRVGFDLKDKDPQQIQQELERLNGLDGLSGRTLQGFDELARQGNSIEEKVRKAMIQRTYIAGFWGYPRLLQCWKELKQCISAIRKQQKIEPFWVALSEQWEHAQSLEDYLALVAVTTQTNQDGWWPQRLDLWPDWQSQQEQFVKDNRYQMKQERHQVRRFLMQNWISAQEKDSLRKNLAALESPKTSWNDLWIYYLRLRAQVEHWQVLEQSKAPGLIHGESEQIQQDDLRRLQDKFKGLSSSQKKSKKS